MRSFLTLLLTVTIHIKFASPGKVYSWYSTLSEWRNLTIQDRRLVVKLEELVRKAKLSLDQLTRQVDRYVKLTEVYLDRASWNSLTPSEIASDYGLMFREFTSDVLRQEFPICRDALRSFGKIMTSFPQTSDYEVAVRTLLELQKSNGLRTKDIANGCIVDTHSDSQLPSDAHFDIAKLACEDFTLQQCLEWCAEAKAHTNDTGVKYNDNDVEAIKTTRRNSERFSYLCAQSLKDTFVENPANSELKCFLWDNSRHPLLILRPVRAELMSISPVIVLLQDVIDKEQVEYLKTKAIPLLGKATTYQREQQISVDNYRVAHNCALNDVTDKKLSRMNRLVDAITGLHLFRSLELLQVANYGIGGHYYAHTDYIEGSRRNRKATLLYYLSDVDYGGATAFIHAGIAVKPVVGRAIFWYNIAWDSGKGNDETLHGGCPVVLGDKWIANKWIWETSRSVCEKDRFI